MVYVIITVFIALSVFVIVPQKSNINKSICFLSIGFFLVLIAGFRNDDVDRDYKNYLLAYYSNYETTRFEPTLTIIVTFVKYTFNNPIFLFVIYAIIGVSLKFVAIKQLSKLYLLSALLYVSNFFILQEMTQIRVGIASGILLLCIKPLYERNFKNFFFLTLIAISFHYSSVIILPLWFLNPFSLKRNLYFSIVPLSYLMVFCGLTLGFLIERLPIEQVQKLYTMYKLQIENGEGDVINLFNSLQVLRCCILLFLIYKIDILSLRNRYSILLVKIYTIALSCFVIFSDIPVVSFRISELLSIVEIVLIPFLLYVFKEKKIAVLFPITIGLFMLLINLFYIKLIL
ncbi:EpsG family protein [Flavobacterium sp. N3904]|uniref:EpsG family protein n=1 Tax=Flavobacterium sp. N3904 TaxID=2986835 RepID=UPI002224942E|nr:EpsG family protein [Flavobacterium sp. N3904]